VPALGVPAPTCVRVVFFSALSIYCYYSRPSGI